MAIAQKITELAVLSAADANDVLAIVDDPAGGAATKKIVASGLNKNFTITAAEIAAGVTPVNFLFEPGNVIRYGAVGDGVADDTNAIQVALDFGKSSGVKIFFPLGTYIVENLTVVTAADLHLSGTPGEKATIKLRADDLLGGVGQILLATDITRMSIRHLNFDGNSANSKTVNTGQTDQLLLITHTTAMSNVAGITLDMDNLEFDGRSGGSGGTANGNGHIRVSSFESASTTFSNYERITLTNYRSISPGHSSSFVFRGTADLIELNNIYCRNDGQFGLIYKGNAFASDTTPIAFSAEVSFGHFIKQVNISNVRTFRNNGFLFMQMVKSHKTSNVFVEESCFNPFFDVAPTTFTVNTGTDIVSATVPTGFTSFPIVQLTTTGTLPAPLAVSPQIFFVRDISGNTFKLALTHTGAAIDITDTGSGTHSVAFLGIGFTTTIKEDDCLYDPLDAGSHSYYNVNLIKETPHSAHRGFSVEESFVDTATPISFDNCDFMASVGLAVRFPGTTHRVRNSSFFNKNEDFTYNEAGSPFVGEADVAYCDFARFVIISTDKDTSYRHCRFKQGFSSSFSGVGCKLTIEDCVFNLDDIAGVLVDFTNPASGTFDIRVLNNNVPVGNTNGFELRILTGAGDLGMTYRVEDNDRMGLASFGIARTATTRLLCKGNNTMQRAETLFPTDTLANAAAPSMVGFHTVKTGGTTAITNFANGVENDKLTVFIQTGDQVNNTATILTRTGANISGPRVTQFVLFGTVWNEI